jgi:cell division protein FtsA
VKKSVLAIDIGSSKVCAIIAEIGEEGSIQVSGVGVVRSHGIKKGSITNIELASKAIKTAINDARRVAGTDIKRAVVSISGAYTKSLNATGIVNIPNKEITLKEIKRVMDTSLYNASIPNEYEVLHTLPYNFIVDDQEFIEDPRGMNASRLEVETHIITTQKSNLSNLKKAVRGAGVEIETVVLGGYASAIAVLNEDEKELGAAVIDIGGSTCDIAIHAGNALRYNDFIGVGSHHITSDLSMALHTPLNIAETVKIQYGSLEEPGEDLIELPMIGDEEYSHEVSLGVVHNVIYARVEETLMIVAQSLERSGLKEQLGAGVVLTGGFTKLDGLRELAIAIFEDVPVRLAKPVEVEGFDELLKEPAMSTAVGLVKYMTGNYAPYEIDVNRKVRYQNGEQAPVHEPHTSGEPERAELEGLAEELPPLQPASGKPDTEQIKIPKVKRAGVGKRFWQWVTQLF